MAHLWIPDAPGEWQPVELDAAAFVLNEARPIRASDLTKSPSSDAVVALRRTGDDADSRWVLLAGPAARVLVNGSDVPVGIAALADRDEIRLSPLPPMFFSTETLSTIAPFPGDQRHGFCPRCQQGIKAGEPAVRCPGCGLWHHASDLLPCWTYAEQCAACPQPTALDAGFQWTPEEL